MQPQTPSRPTGPLKRLRHRLDAALQRTARAGADGVLRISPRQVYILPTRYGVIFACLLFGMLIGSQNYGINLGFMLTFLLAGLGLAALLQTWRNLVGLQIRCYAAAPVFAGNPAQFELVLINRRRTPRSAIQIKLAQHVAMTDLPPNAERSVQVHALAARRGWFQPPRMCVLTFFPLGLFYAWAYFDSGQTCLVYPQAAAQAGGYRFAAFDANVASATARQQHEIGDFSGHRDYVVGDNLRQLDWKALARGRGWQIKQYLDQQGDQVWLDWDATGEPATEQRLRLLCRAVLELSEQGVPFGLRLPGLSLEPQHGLAHRHRCLKALALFDTPD